MPLPDVTGPAPGASAGQLPRCLVFPDGDDWIVFGPRSLLALRVNAEAAARFRDLPDPGPEFFAIGFDVRQGIGFGKNFDILRPHRVDREYAWFQCFSTGF